MHWPAGRPLVRDGVPLIRSAPAWPAGIAAFVKPRAGAPEGLHGIPGCLDGIWTESKKLDGKTWKIWKSAIRGGDTSYFCTSLSGFPYSPLAMCKIGKLSFVAGAEMPQRYIVT